MRYGTHCFILTDHWDDRQIGLFETAHALGLRAFEIAVGDDVACNGSVLRRKAEALDLQLVVSPGGLWPREHDLSSSDAGERKAALAWHRQQMGGGADMGAVAYTGALYGHPGTLHGRTLRDEELDWIAEGLTALAEEGVRLGMNVVIEPMSRFRTHVITTAAQAMAMLERSGHPNLSVVLDTYHLLTETRDYGAEVRRCAGCLWGLHASESDRGCPGGGFVPWDAVYAALKDIGFDGYIVFESYNTGIGDLAARRGLPKDLCPDGAAFLRRGMDYLRGQARAVGIDKA